MKRPAVRCRCGHQVLAKEVLRTDLYERPSGREYVYVKYRCKRCKRVGETFVAENRWDWRIFEASQHEMSESEWEEFADQTPISSEDLLDFHRLLVKISTTTDLAATAPAVITENSSAETNEGNAISESEISSETAGANVQANIQTVDESTPDAKNEPSIKHSRIEPKRGDFKSGNDGLKSNPDPEAKKDIKKDAGKTSGPEDSLPRS